MRKLEIVAARAFYCSLMAIGLIMFLYGVFHNPETIPSNKAMVINGMLLTCFTVFAAMYRTENADRFQKLMLHTIAVLFIIITALLFSIKTFFFIDLAFCGLCCFTERTEQKYNFRVL